MPDNYVKVLTALGMHSNKLKLSGRLTVEFELPEMKNPLCSGVIWPYPCNAAILGNRIPTYPGQAR